MLVVGVNSGLSTFLAFPRKGMVMTVLPQSPSGQFIVQAWVNLYDRPVGEDLASQGAPGRYLKLTDRIEQSRILVAQLEDGYQGWLALKDLAALAPAPQPYQWQALGREEIRQRLPLVIDYVLRAQQTDNYYLWGGNVGPNYDCSGLVQAAFRSQDIWLPRDSYQQAAFCQNIVDVAPQRQRGEELPLPMAAIAVEFVPGDLIFFGSQRVDHVGLYLGAGQYVHSSGKTMGRNGIGRDSLTDLTDPISAKYAQKWWQCGRVIKSFDPSQDPLAIATTAVNRDLLK